MRRGNAARQAVLASISGVSNAPIRANYCATESLLRPRLTLCPSRTAVREGEDHYLLRDGASGIFLAASQFPKHRETVRRWSQKSNLTPMNWTRNSATLAAPDKTRTVIRVIRYSRKTKEQYGLRKGTGWKALPAELGRRRRAEKTGYPQEAG